MSRLRRRCSGRSVSGFIEPLESRVLLSAVTGIPAMMGSGNIVHGRIDSTGTADLDALNTAGMGAVRADLFPGDYYNSSTGTVNLSIDALMLASYQHGITPEILFEWTTSYGTLGNY